PFPSVGPAASIPHRIRCFPRHPPATTISGTAPLSSSPTPDPLAQCLSRAPHIPCVRSAYRRSLSSPWHSSLPGTPRPSSAGFRPHFGARASVHPQPGVHDHRRAQCPPRTFLLAGVPLVASALVATSSVGAIPLEACIRHSADTTRSLSVVCQSPASASSPRRSSWYS
ncbi:hypothetical protein DFH08DRAFT_908143, partial [Mycena albidolilacea]